MNGVADYLNKRYGGWYELAQLYDKKWKSSERTRCAIP
jgi:hypothetical protein